jgi:hypothetical protein
MAGRWLLATSLVVLVAARSVPAQAPLAFEVASLTPSPYPNARKDLFTPPDSLIIITNYALRDLIAYADGLKSRHELAGGPEWLLQEKFVINTGPDAPRDQEGRLVCGTSTTISGLDGATLRIRGVPIGELAGRLDTAEYTGLDRPLVGRTGLTGTYDVHLTFAVPVRASGAPLQTTPPIAVALREQLGLTLESRTAPGCATSSSPLSGR